MRDGEGNPIRSSQIDIENALLKFGYEPNEPSRIELSGSVYHDGGTTPPNANAVASGATDVDLDASMARLSWIYAPPGADLVDLSALLYWNGLKITEDRYADGRNDVTRYETWGVDVTNRSRFEIGGPVTLVYGVEAFRDIQKGTRDGADRPQYPAAEANTVGLYAEATIELTDRLGIIPGLRFDTYDRNPNDPALDTVNENFLSPRIGVSYRPNDAWQIYGYLARAFRAPSMIELFNDGVHFAIDGFPMGPGLAFSGVNYFIPNPNLDPEESNQVEIDTRYSRQGVFRDGDSVDFTANLYYAEVKNYIKQVLDFMDFSRPSFGPDRMDVSGSTTTENVDATSGASRAPPTMTWSVVRGADPHHSPRRGAGRRRARLDPAGPAHRLGRLPPALRLGVRRPRHLRREAGRRARGVGSGRGLDHRRSLRLLGARDGRARGYSLPCRHRQPLRRAILDLPERPAAARPHLQDLGRRRLLTH
jgi:hemoglobin/transferrin/lactoferrin receptor protein